MKQANKILFLVRLYHPHIGGVEKHVKELCSELSKKGFSITIVTEQFDNTLKLHDQFENVEIYRVPIGRNQFFKKFYIWRWVIENRSLLFSHDIIHVHDVFYWLLPVRFLLPLKKIYITFHGYEGYPVKMRWILLRKLSELLSSGSICVGDFMKKWYWTSPDKVIYGGVRENGSKFSQNPHSAVFFGRLDDQTGILEYIEAYKKIKERYPNFRLTVVGNGEFESKIPDDVILKPFTSNVNKYITQNRFIFVSRYLSMLEAMVSKKEVIAIFNNEIKRDYLLMSPFKKYVFVAKSSDEIATYIMESLKSRKKSEKRVENGYKWALAQTWDEISNVYLSLWKIK